MNPEIHVMNPEIHVMNPEIHDAKTEFFSSHFSLVKTKKEPSLLALLTPKFRCEKCEK